MHFSEESIYSSFTIENDVDHHTAFRWKKIIGTRSSDQCTFLHPGFEMTTDSREDQRRQERNRTSRLDQVPFAASFDHIRGHLFQSLLQMLTEHFIGLEWERPCCRGGGKSLLLSHPMQISNETLQCIEFPQHVFTGGTASSKQGKTTAERAESGPTPTLSISSSLSRSLCESIVRYRIPSVRRSEWPTERMCPAAADGTGRSKANLIEREESPPVQWNGISPWTRR